MSHHSSNPDRSHAHESTPDRRYQVFISSTFKGLEEHRAQAALGVISAGHLPVALENSPPDPSTKRDVIEKAIDLSQFYVIILGSRYGSPIGKRVNKGFKSYVEMEYDYAVSRGKKILVFVMDESLLVFPPAARVPRGKHSVDDPFHYRLFRDRLTKGANTVFHSQFTSSSTIKEQLVAFFSRPHNDVPGYVLELPEREKELLRIYAKNEIIRDVVQGLDKFQEVEPRLAVAPDKKRALADAFAALYGEYIHSHYFSQLFLESGSTVTYVAKAIASQLPKSGRDHRAGKLVSVSTNNAFAYLYLWLCERVFCRPIPEGPPDEKYGGMYGPLTFRHREPDYTGRPLHEVDPDAVTLLKEIPTTVFGKAGERSLILAAASGLQLSESFTIREMTGEPCTHDDTVNAIKRFRGFHGGSYRNKLFKRGLYASHVPAIFFVHDEKIDCPIIAGKCHFGFDGRSDWNEFVATYPFAVWVGCDRNSYRSVAKLCEKFLGADWCFKIYGESHRYPTVIATNRNFRERMTRIGVTH